MLQSNILSGDITGFRVRQTKIWIQARNLTSCVAFTKLHNPFVPQFPHLLSGNNNNSIIGFFWGLSEKIYFKHLTYCVVPGKDLLTERSIMVMTFSGVWLFEPVSGKDVIETLSRHEALAKRASSSKLRKIRRSEENEVMSIKGNWRQNWRDPIIQEPWRLDGEQ